MEISGPGRLGAWHLSQVLFFGLILYAGLSLLRRVYEAYYGLLSKFPGPKLSATSILPWSRSTWNGSDHLDLARLHRKYGEVVRFGPNELSFIGNHQIWKDVYGFRRSGQPPAIKDPVFYGKPADGATGMFTADDENHARQRRIVSHAFSDKAMKEQASLLKFWAMKLETELTEKARRAEMVDMVAMMEAATFEIMSDLTFAEPLGLLDNPDEASWVKVFYASLVYGTRLRALRIISSSINAALDTISYLMPSFRKAEAEYSKHITDRVDRRLARTPARPDLWTSILDKGGRPTDTGKPGQSFMTLSEHYMLAASFMTAGTETSATALSGTIFHLLQNPGHLKDLQKEIRARFKSIDEMDMDALASLPVLDATLKEGLRLYPPVAGGLPRVSPVGGMMVGQYFVPEGTSIAIHHYATYRQEDKFKHADEFRPERWMGDVEFRDDDFDAFEPFSVGPRGCLGKNLAWHEMRFILASVILHFDLELSAESRSWMDQKVFTLWEKHPLVCKVTRVA